MISKSVEIEKAYEFALDLCKDSRYSDPFHHTPEELWAAIHRFYHKEDRDTFCVMSGDTIIGLFSFLIIPEDSYLESSLLLSKNSDAYDEMWEYLVSRYPEWNMDFVYNPKNLILTGLLEKGKASFFEVEQIVMRFEGKSGKRKQTDAIVPYEECYRSEYCRLHSTDAWWTAERVLENPEKFTVFLALCEDHVVGYIDVSHWEKGNLVSDLRVAESHWNRGFGRGLLYQAIMESGSVPLTLQVNIDNEPAKHLYASSGFIPVENENTITAHVTLKK